jgi:hypothetical protein
MRQSPMCVSREEALAYPSLARALVEAYPREAIEKMVSKESVFKKFMQGTRWEPEVCRFEELER